VLSKAEEEAPGDEDAGKDLPKGIVVDLNGTGKEEHAVKNKEEAHDHCGPRSLVAFDQFDVVLQKGAQVSEAVEPIQVFGPGLLGLSRQSPIQVHMPLEIQIGRPVKSDHQGPWDDGRPRNIVQKIEQRLGVPTD